MLESIRVTEKLRWPELELSKKSVLLYPTGKNGAGEAGLQQVPVSILKEIFTGSNGYNVLLPSKGEKKRTLACHHKKHRKSAKPSAVSRFKERRNPSTSVPLVAEKWCLESRNTQFLAIKIMNIALQKYGSYENFEQATGGNLLTKSRIWFYVKKYMEKENCLGDIAVHLTDDLLSRASMTIVNGRPTLTINISTAREHWLEGMLRHEIGTHYIRGLNNNLQPWNNWTGRRKHGLKPINPTEEGLASIHSVLFRKDPFLWRAALLYYTVYQASHMSFSELFLDIGKFVENANTRWDYCVRAKRGQTDTSQPGCFSKDQVYLDGILKILRHRDSIDFQLLTALGKVSYEDVDRLKIIAILQNAQIPHFMQDQARYLEQLDKIMKVNGLTDCELQVLI
ncbi:putative tyrosine carboxypeptidase MATCAP2 isoform X5 [Narcine bancroftii]|uniref:putative tyrosine carboxypeptidase MATCAP2 isoform X5 n=1 Tax=Narcine bancroftii TaxID=1343680 RepID=UPI003831CC6C